MPGAPPPNPVEPDDRSKNKGYADHRELDIEPDTDFARDLRELSTVMESDRLVALDHSVLNAAVARLAGVRRRRAAAGRLRRTIGLAAAAAAVFIIALVGVRVLTPTPPDAPNSVAHGQPVAGDVNGDGRVDVIDAYLIARALNDGRTVEVATESGGMRAALARDVESMMRHIVALDPSSALQFEGGGS